MGLKDIDIKVSYAGKGEDILKHFLLPSIDACVRYDRVTSFYTVESLLAISQGIDSLYKKHGKMRLIIGIHSFPGEFVDAVTRKKYLENQISEIREQLRLGIESIKDNLEKRRLATIAWMIEDNLLEIKTADVLGEGIFHPKTLILVDENSEKIVAIGSPNETSCGLGGNFEQVMVAKSWEQPDAVTVQENFFDSLWNNKLEDAVTLDVTECTAEIIKQGLGEYYCTLKSNHSSKSDLIKMSSSMLSNFFVSGDIPALYVHQERAVIDALSRWPVRVLFADEVGLGKTFEVASTMVFMVKYCGVKRVLILTPKSVLKQWQDELKEYFKLNVWRYDSGSKSYIDAFDNIKYAGTPNPIGKGSPDIILMSAQYARGAGNNLDIFSKEGACLPELLILDEAHSARVSKDISGGSKKTQVYAMLERVSNKIPHIILATATPMQKEAGEYHSLLKLLGLPKAWQKSSVYMKSLDLIGCSEFPSLSDLNSAASMLYKTIEDMKPSIERLSVEQQHILAQLVDLQNEDSTIITNFVRENWQIIRQLLVLLHPAHLLTVRNTRRALAEMGYKFPNRKLTPVSIPNSMEVELFYNSVNGYLSEKCFSIEEILFPDRKISIGFVRVSYQQRVASSIYSCKKSLERRLEKIKSLKATLERYLSFRDAILYNPTGLDDIELEELLDEGYDDTFNVDLSKIDISALQQAIALESTCITPLLKRANSLLDDRKDLKIMESIALAKNCLGDMDKVLIFSRYTDTIDALINEFNTLGFNKYYKYGVYTGAKSCIVFGGEEIQCSKNDLKHGLFSGEIRIVFCSDAASEGLNLQAARILINVDVPWTPARLEQRIGRIARLGQIANEVVVYNVWYPHSIEARMYHRIQKRLENSNLAIGEFPDIVAKKIRKAIMDGEDNENLGLNELLEIRNSKQVAALEELWSQSGNSTESELMRERLLRICSMCSKQVDTDLGGIVKVFETPDGARYHLTSKCGMAESISLKSIIWDYFTFSDDTLNVVQDLNQRPACFTTNKDGKTVELKHSSIPKVILKEKLDREDVLIGYPSMLPCGKRLDLSYAIDCELTPAPIYWIK
ncbi:MAG: DEAD/DEAH box helicase family protein [Bacteroidales bacterium]|nr:DEAD/DEAH box helicase family protein [Bacteroidales bacterium]